MRRAWLALLALAILAVWAVPATAQPVVSAKSGMVSYVMGTVYLDGQQMDDVVAQFPYMKENGTLRTTEGRAEVMMNPGMFLRLGENSELRMITNRFIDTRVELVKGSAVVQFVTEFTGVQKDNHFTLVLKDATVDIAKPGDYRFDVDPARIKVFAGLANVQVGKETTAVTGGKMLNLGAGTASVEKFDTKETDALDRWSGQRGQLNAQAAASSARQVNDQYDPRDPCYGYSYSRSYAVPVGQNPCVGTWRYNPWYGLWTYIPFGRVYCDPMWGYCYYNPRDVMGAYYRPPVIWNPSPSYGGGGMGGYSPTYSGSSGSAAAASTAMSSSSAGSGSSAAAASTSSGSAGSSVGHGAASSGGHGK